MSLSLKKYILSVVSNIPYVSSQSTGLWLAVQEDQVVGRLPLLNDWIDSWPADQLMSYCSSVDAKGSESERDRGQIDRDEAWAVPECHLLRRSPDKQIYVSSPRRSTVLKFINKAVIGAGAPKRLKGPQQTSAWVTARRWLQCAFDCVPTAIC